MKVIIMCGGKGTRLREETSVKPKPMVEIGGRPVLWHIMSIYARFGFKDFVLPLGYKGEVIKQYFHDYNIRNTDFTVELKSGTIISHPGHVEDWRVTLCDTGQETLKGGRIKRVAKYIDSDRFMVTYGDGVADIDLHKLLEFHKQSGTIGTFTGVRMPASGSAWTPCAIPSSSMNSGTAAGPFGCSSPVLLSSGGVKLRFGLQSCTIRVHSCRPQLVFLVGEQNSRPAVEYAPGRLSTLPARKNYRAAMNKKTIQLSPTSKE